MKGVDAKFLKNLRFARKNNKRQINKPVESKA
ncbi:Protein CBR-RPL-29 [Caenorhabditis briggsae]|uniref:Protein CBR-RPL-29 n=1 Tax=Caenorhabditis briggsae TaxID=6238 RepID=A8Y255_CAEBR|nr:Protein CBR-RPL-29 [Caenorhabditis briggsae]CAP38995.2 Protein CBR-RPL-29 [Caenorhabditis briggsae]